MNLVIDDAVEVKQPTKTEDETRRDLGTRGPRRVALLSFANKLHKARYF